MTSYTAFLALLAQAPSGGSPVSFFLMIGLFMVAMYFFMIAPQRKKDKAHKQMIASLKNGDRVITIGGIMGTVTAVKEDRFHIKIDDSTRIEVLKTAIQGVQPSAQSTDS